MVPFALHIARSMRPNTLRQQYHSTKSYWWSCASLSVYNSPTLSRHTARSSAMTNHRRTGADGIHRSIIFIGYYYPMMAASHQRVASSIHVGQVVSGTHGTLTSRRNYLSMQQRHISSRLHLLLWGIVSLTLCDNNITQQSRISEVAHHSVWSGTHGTTHITSNLFIDAATINMVPFASNIIRSIRPNTLRQQYHSS